MSSYYIWSGNTMFSDLSIVGTSHETKEDAEAFLKQKGFKPTGYDEWNKGLVGVFVTSEEDYKTLTTPH